MYLDTHYKDTVYSLALKHFINDKGLTLEEGTEKLRQDIRNSGGDEAEKLNQFTLLSEAVESVKSEQRRN